MRSRPSSGSAIRSLLVIDLDSALCGPDGRACERDRRALGQLPASDAHLAFASSRRAAAALERLRALALAGWVIGADGAEVARLDGSRVIHHALPSSVAARCAERLRSHGLPVFALTTAALHGQARHASVATESIGPLADVYTDTPPRLADVQSIAAAGPADAVRAAAAELERLAPTRIAARAFPISALHALRVRPVRATRARAVDEICVRLGVRRAHAVYVGGALHPAGDPAAFSSGGRAYCVGVVPEPLAAGAHRLACAAGDGAVAEALERWRDERDLAARAHGGAAGSAGG